MQNLNLKIKDYWEGEAELYNFAIEKELKSPKSQAWKELILENAPKREKLQILDIGTGPGLFPVIFSQEGHEITGIDITENMISFAKKNAEAAGVSPKLLTMDCKNLDFPDNSFDLLICRNITWTLENPEKAYSEWLRVLRPGGRLLVFDACWYLYLFDKEIGEKYRIKEQEVLEKYGRKMHNHKNQSDGDALSTKLFMSDKYRPSWDLTAMLKLGFKKVFADCSIAERVSSEEERDIYEVVPPFMVGAEK